MKTLATLAVAMLLGIGAIGCTKQEAKKTTETKITTPGGETKMTVDEKLETKGDAPPGGKVDETK